MKEIPLWLASGPLATGTTAGVGAARAVGRRGRRLRKIEAFMVMMGMLRRIEGRVKEDC